MYDVEPPQTILVPIVRMVASKYGDTFSVTTGDFENEDLSFFRYD